MDDDGLARLAQTFHEGRFTTTTLRRVDLAAAEILREIETFGQTWPTHARSKKLIPAGE
uniref:Uncharacterized protein n=1 Tax=Marseillevirus LCMAC103 TaxID=2506604 RepID=A0A481YX25_9VIRU|nr:MAG: hypothetical protein LCMAC103_04200 [Marseillevirus LCMAC103]